MEQAHLIILLTLSIALLLWLILKLRLHAFLSLLIISILTGLAAGMEPMKVIESVQNGMGGVMGFVAVVVGLGAIFGQILESSGGAHALAHRLVQKFGLQKAPYALMLAGFLIAIPVFFEVGFIILVPIVYALTRDTGKSILFFAIPVTAGLAVTHAFIPPTPGPVVVAQILEVQLGWVIIIGTIVGLPTAVVAGIWFGKRISQKLVLPNPIFYTEEDQNVNSHPPVSFTEVFMIILLPIVLIILGTVLQFSLQEEVIQGKNTLGIFLRAVIFLSHPFLALIVANIAAFYFLGVRKGFSRSQLLDLSNKSLAPAGVIILVTGAGGVFKQVLIDSGIGNSLAESMQSLQLSPILLAYFIAVLIRVSQGSATVAMVTAAGLAAPLIESAAMTEVQKAMVVIAIAAGSTILSHVNDSGFWLVSKYLGLNEKQTLQSWTVMETIISVMGIVLVMILSLFV